MVFNLTGGQSFPGSGDRLGRFSLYPHLGFGDAPSGALMAGSRFQHGALRVSLHVDRRRRWCRNSSTRPEPVDPDDLLPLAARVVADPGRNDVPLRTVSLVEFEQRSAIRTHLQIPVSRTSRMATLSDPVRPACRHVQFQEEPEYTAAAPRLATLVTDLSRRHQT